MSTTATLNMASAIFAFLAAALWLISTAVRRKGKAVPPEVIMGNGEIDNGTLLAATLRMQGRFSAAAAVAAAAASILQGIANLP